MAKNITILEGGTSKSFSNVNKLRVNNVGGGTSDWVPEDETQLTTKHISENGTYTASDDGYYGYSEVTVSGVGGFSYTAREGDSIGGVDLTEGNEYDISADPVTGDVVVESLPTYIAIAHQPNKTSYIDGEAIDTDGLIVQAYTANGELWENENYFQSMIPINEITISPAIATYGPSDSESATGDNVDGTYYVSSGSAVSICTQPDGTGGNIVVPAGVTFCGIKYENSDSFYIAAIGDEPFELRSYSQIDGVLEGTVVATTRTFDGVMVYYAYDGWVQPVPTPTIDYSVIGPTDSMAETAFNIMRGSGSRQLKVNVKWPRPSDDEELTTSFKIQVEDGE